MRIGARAFALCKAGNTADEYEDAYWPERPVDRDIGAVRCAVADGATETSFAAPWARLLVRAYCRGHLSPRALPRRLPELRAQWRQAVCARPLPWYAEEKVRAGAFAAVAGLTIWQDHQGIRWSSAALGDCCVFQVRDDELLTTFPVIQLSDFSSRPRLLSSNSEPAAESPRLTTAAGHAAEGDVFFLMTDALAAWFLARHEGGEWPWRRLHCSEAFDGRSFADWIDRLRMEKEIRNDDVTLLTLQLS
jgi:hypothetical protein